MQKDSSTAEARAGVVLNFAWVAALAPLLLRERMWIRVPAAFAVLVATVNVVRVLALYRTLR